MSNSWFYSLISVFSVSLISLIGIFTFSIKLEKIKKYLLFLILFTAGGFLYIANADLIPELKKETGLKKSIFQFLGLLLGILLMFLIR